MSERYPIPLWKRLSEAQYDSGIAAQPTLRETYAGEVTRSDFVREGLAAHRLSSANDQRVRQ
ncbi:MULTISPECIES: hypothetical protein [Nocardia]|uniref:hypothetical protein n=1 Tax=Nocardia TaxID=1817 RepID=UPI000D698B9F|nr:MULTISPECIES: hypothetical protein [Nocardia]